MWLFGRNFIASDAMAWCIGAMNLDVPERIGQTAVLNPLLTKANKFKSIVIKLRSKGS
jgi:hypothetical protein